MVTPTPGRAAASQTLKTIKIETCGAGEEEKKQKTKQKDDPTVCAGTCASPFRFAQVAHQTLSRRTTPTTSTVVVSSSSLSDRLFRTRLLRDSAKKSWVLVQIFVCIVFVIFLEAKQRSARNYRAQTDRQTGGQTDWLTGRQDKTDRRLWKEGSLHRPISR